MESRFQAQLTDQRLQSQQVEQSLSDKIQAVKEKKRKIKADKNQLLDFVEESVQKQQAEEIIKQKLQAQVRDNDVLIRSLRDEREQLLKDKDNLDDLIKQTQLNIRQMREEKEAMSQQIQQL